MSTKAKIFSAFLSAGLMLPGLSPLGNSLARAQSGTGTLGQYTKNQLGNIKGANSASRFSTSRYTQHATRTSVPRYAQYNNSKIQSRVFGSLASSRPKNKPFSSASRGPTVTPYLGLGGLPTGGAPNYYTNVKPRLEQQRVNRRNQQRNQALQHQLNQVAAQPPFNPKGSEAMAPTGHAAAFMNYGGYYPQRR